MRPGPGLVVMALAFISGARRGTTQQLDSPSLAGKLGKGGDDSTGALTQINPWLSACDLAQPNSAPDLQVHTQPIDSTHGDTKKLYIPASPFPLIPIKPINFPNPVHHICAPSVCVYVCMCVTKGQEVEVMREEKWPPAAIFLLSNIIRQMTKRNFPPFHHPHRVRRLG